jgi:hypothetical protein
MTQLTKKQRKQKHIEELYAIGLQKGKFSQLVKIEHKAAKLAVDACNFLSMESPQYNLRHKEIINDLQILFYPKHLPKGLFVNGDPRGYSLKIKTEDNGEYPNRIISYTDWGGYGILVPEEYEN